MKKLTYLLTALGLITFTACGGGGSTDQEAQEATEVATCCCGDAACAGECHAEETAEKVGCQVEGGECLADHSCCAAKEEAEHSHEHDHSDGESHDHEHDHSDGESHDHEH